MMGSRLTYELFEPCLDQTQKTVKYSVVNQPKFSGCMKFGKEYRAYTEQGTYLKTDQSVCERLMKSGGDRPYDYFNDRKVVAQPSELVKETKDEKPTGDNVPKDEKKEIAQVAQSEVKESVMNQYGS